MLILIRTLRTSPPSLVIKGAIPIKKSLSVFTLIFSVILIAILYSKLHDPLALQVLLSSLGWKGVLLDLLILSLQMLIPIVPFALLAGANTILYGWFFGFLLSLTGSMLGSTLGFFLARTLGLDMQRSPVPLFAKLSRKFGARYFLLVFTCRLIPVIPGAIVNYAAGMSKMKLRTFLSASILGKIPMIAWESWFGHDFWQITSHPQRFLWSLSLGAAVLGGTFLLNKRFI